MGPTRHLAATALLLPASLTAQDGEHPFIASFALTELDGRIRVEWTMRGGSTCDGSEVERSLDGAAFTMVHRIGGICGDAALDVPFVWYDEDPPELSVLHYRVKLGNDGYSSVKSIAFRQLRSADHRLFPSPMRGEATLLLKVSPSAQVDVAVHDARGNLVWERNGATGREHLIALPGAAAGLYLYTVRTGGRTWQGRFVKE